MVIRIGQESPTTADTPGKCVCVCEWVELEKLGVQHTILQFMFYLYQGTSFPNSVRAVRQGLTTKVNLLHQFVGVVVFSPFFV